MKPCPVVEEFLGAGLPVAMCRGAGSAPFLTRYLPPCGRRRFIPVPPQIQAFGG
jgi:hypothetical protein